MMRPLFVAVVVAQLLGARPVAAAPTPFLPGPSQPTAPQAPFVPLPAPPLPFSPSAAALGQAYAAIARASIVDPNVAERAQYAYRMALSRLRMGDRVGAASFAASALAIAGSAGTGEPVAPVASVAPVAPRVPANAASAFAEAPLPDYVVAARNRIWAAKAKGTDVAAATVHLRRAVDAYLDGDAVKSRAEAAAAVKALP